MSIKLKKSSLANFVFTLNVAQHYFLHPDQNKYQSLRLAVFLFFGIKCWSIALILGSGLCFMLWEVFLNGFSQ
jgi:hypothetical protein